MLNKRIILVLIALLPFLNVKAQARLDTSRHSVANSSIKHAGISQLPENARDPKYLLEIHKNEITIPNMDTTVREEKPPHEGSKRRP
jgi:hypothetical protein